MIFVLICIFILSIGFVSAITCPAGTRQEFAGGSCIPIVGESGKAAGTGTSASTSSSAATASTSATGPSVSFPSNTPTQAEVNAAKAEADRLYGEQQTAWDRYSKTSTELFWLLDTESEEFETFSDKQFAFEDTLFSEEEKDNSITHQWSEADLEIVHDWVDCRNSDPHPFDYCWSIGGYDNTPEYQSCLEASEEWQDACSLKSDLANAQLDQWHAKTTVAALDAKAAEYNKRIAELQKQGKGDKWEEDEEPEEQNQPQQAAVPPFQSIVNFDNNFQPLDMHLSQPQIDMLGEIPPARIHDLFHSAANNAVQNNPNLQNLANANLQNSPLANRLGAENPDAASKLQKGVSLPPPSLGNFINQEVNKLFNT